MNLKHSACSCTKLTDDVREILKELREQPHTVTEEEKQQIYTRTRIESIRACDTYEEAKHFGSFEAQGKTGPIRVYFPLMAMMQDRDHTAMLFVAMGLAITSAGLREYTK